LAYVTFEDVALTDVTNGITAPGIAGTFSIVLIPGLF
jgi:hypothetical protein